jgi:hypothetical protein
MAEFDVRGDWNAIQSNGFAAHFHIDQVPPGGTGITANASHSDSAVNSTDAGGRVEGNQFLLEVSWDNGTRGMYTGTFGLAEADGRHRITGVTFDEQHPESQATWFSDQTFRRKG